MDIQGRRRSDNFEDRGAGSPQRSGGGLPLTLLFSVVRRLGVKGSLIAAVLCAGAYFFLPTSVRQMFLGQVTGSSAGATTGSPGKGVCQTTADSGEACDFSRVILASTEDVWTKKFQTAELPEYGGASPRAYQEPSLVVFSGGVSTGGCGNATSAVGPFYCPADRKLYIDPSFYKEMASRLKAPGDFAQAYVLAHEVGHHIQNLIGSSRKKVQGETKNQVSVRVELQADCFAGVWGHTARGDLQITEEDLGEALAAAHAIGDDTLGHSDEAKFTHGSSAQRIRWFRQGYQSGDPKKCDTFAVKASKL